MKRSDYGNRNAISILSHLTGGLLDWPPRRLVLEPVSLHECVAAFGELESVLDQMTNNGASYEELCASRLERPNGPIDRS